MYCVGAKITLEELHRPWIYAKMRIGDMYKLNENSIQTHRGGRAAMKITRMYLTYNDPTFADMIKRIFKYSFFLNDDELKDVSRKDMLAWRDGKDPSEFQNTDDEGNQLEMLPINSTEVSALDEDDGVFHQK